MKREPESLRGSHRSCQGGPDAAMTGDPRMLALVRAVHTAIFLVMAGSVFYVLYCGMSGTWGRGLYISLGLLAIEGVIFYSNGRKCPLTALAKRYGAEKGYVFDSFFPERLTRYTFPFFTTLLVIALALLLARATLLRSSSGASKISSALSGRQPVAGSGISQTMEKPALLLGSGL